MKTWKSDWPVIVRILKHVIPSRCFILFLTPLLWFCISVQEVGVTKPTFFDLLPFKLAKMLVGFCKSLPGRYQALLEYWRERRKEKIEEEEEEEDDDDEETEGAYDC